jgi:hypothetical protein
MGTRISAEDRAAWLSAAANAGLSPNDTRKELIERAKAFGFDVHWIVAQGHDILGVEHERMMAYLHSNEAYYDGELLSADSVEEAICLVVGEALVKRSQSSEYEA